MSGISTEMAVGMGEVGGYGYRPPPFTAVQWQELEHQAMIYKYLVAGLPVPPDLVIPIRRSFDALSARFFQHPSLGYCSYYGKKFDPEPGRCRRTDGKKWRCSKDAYVDSKYCERHMHRGRNRSRKPVESQSTSQSVSTAASHITTGNSSGSGSLPASGSGGSFQNMPAYSVVSPGVLSFGSNATKLQLEPVNFDNKDYRYLNGLTSGAEEYNFSSEGGGTVRSMGMSSNADNTWRLLPSEVSSNSLLKATKSDSWLLGNSSHAFEPMVDSTASKQHQQHSFFGSEIDAPVPLKQEQHSMRSFFDEWPTSKESWSNLDNEASNKNAFSTTQLSISIPVAPPEFSSRDS